MENKTHDELMEFMSLVGVRKVLIEKYPYKFRVRIINSTDVNGSTNWWWYSKKYIGYCFMVIPCYDLVNVDLKIKFGFTANDFYIETETTNIILKRDCVVKL